MKNRIKQWDSQTFKCYFCGNPAAERMIITEENEILHQINGIIIEGKAHNCCAPCKNYINTFIKTLLGDLKKHGGAINFIKRCA